MWGVQKKRQKKRENASIFSHTLGASHFFYHFIFFIVCISLFFANTHTHTQKEKPARFGRAQKLSSSSSKKTPQPRKRYEKKAVVVVVVRATFWEHRSAWIRDGGFRARVILESPRRGPFRFVAFRLVFLPRARGQMMFFEKGCILGLRKRGGGGSMSSFPGRDSADANVGRKVRAFTRAH